MVPGLVSGRQALAPADKPAGEGSSCQRRAGSSRSVGSLPVGAFQPSQLAGGCRRLPAPSQVEGRLMVSRVDACALLSAVPNDVSGRFASESGISKTSFCMGVIPGDAISSSVSWPVLPVGLSAGVLC